MNRAFKVFSFVDWIVGTVSLLLGLYWANGWLVAGGFIGLLFAWLKPAQRLKNKIEKSILRKKANPDDSGITVEEDAFYASMLGETTESLKATSLPLPENLPKHYSRPAPFATLIVARQSKHNLLNTKGLNLAGKGDSGYF